MSIKQHALRCAVYVLLIEKNKILLNLRKNTGWMDNFYGLPSGHLNENETIIQATIRETKEEIGININSKNLKFVHLMHRNDPKDFEYIDIFFVLDKWNNKPVNNEPEKCEHIKWFDITSLPKNIVPNVKTGIFNSLNKIFFSEFKK